VRLLVNAASQWLHATTGRITTDPHSWLTAVHWITDCAAKGLYTPTQKHSPKWGPTTIALAQEIAALKVCRPGIAYLMRKLKASERTIQYHLAMLRETGLLVYRSNGTRARGEANQASVYERTIPAAFDAEHGIRTVGEGVQRRPVGAAEKARKALGTLAKKAARKTRRRPRRAPVSGRGRCTPMEGGTSSTSSTGLTHSPPESKLASGQEKSPTPKQSKRGPRTLNRVGRRYQLAAELIRTVPWLHHANRARIAWIIRHVADAGWTSQEIQAAAERLPLPERGALRPSGLLASRLASCHLLYTTKDRRRVLVEDWRDFRAAEQDRHQEHATFAQGPTRQSVRNLMSEAIRRTRQIATGPIDDTGCHDVPAGAETSLEDLDNELVTACRAEATADPAVITDALALGMSETDARQLYTHRLVDQALALQAINARRAELAPAF
jgi:hypothetical protein